MKRIIIALAVLMFLVVGCSQAPPAQQAAPEPSQQQQTIVVPSPDDDAQQSSQEQPAQQATTPQSEDTAASASDSTVKEFDMAAKRFAFSPNVITVNRGDTVRLHITAQDVAHGIAIPEFGVNVYLPVGKTVDAEFVADQPGEFPFRCNVFCGDGHQGMTGKVVVN